MHREPAKKGELYSRLYVDRGRPASDGARMRIRVAGYYMENLYETYGKDIARAITRELGVNVYNHLEVPKFFRDTPDVRDVLSSITVVYRVLLDGEQAARKLGFRNGPESSRSECWLAFVGRVLQEENLAYWVDDKAGVHPLVDTEFEHNVAATLRGLGGGRYTAVRHALDAARAKIESVPQDRKGAIRDLFEGVETLTKLITKSGKALDASFVTKELRPQVDKLHGEDPVARQSGGRMCQS